MTEAVLLSKCVVYQYDRYHRGEDQGPSFQRLNLDIEHLDLSESNYLVSTCVPVIPLIKILAYSYGIMYKHVHMYIHVTGFSRPVIFRTLCHAIFQLIPSCVLQLMKQLETAEKSTLRVMDDVQIVLSSVFRRVGKRGWWVGRVMQCCPSFDVYV